MDFVGIIPDPTSFSDHCRHPLPRKQPLWILQQLQRGQEPPGGLPGRLHPDADGAGDGRRDGLRVPSPDRAQHEVPADVRPPTL